MTNLFKLQNKSEYILDVKKSPLYYSNIENRNIRSDNQLYEAYDLPPTSQIQIKGNLKFNVSSLEPKVILQKLLDNALFNFSDQMKQEFISSITKKEYFNNVINEIKEIISKRVKYNDIKSLQAYITLNRKENYFYTDSDVSEFTRQSIEPQHSALEIDYLFFRLKTPSLMITSTYDPTTEDEDPRYKHDERFKNKDMFYFISKIIWPYIHYAISSIYKLPIEYRIKWIEHMLQKQTDLINKGKFDMNILFDTPIIMDEDELLDISYAYFHPLNITTSQHFFICYPDINIELLDGIIFTIKNPMFLLDAVFHLYNIDKTNKTPIQVRNEINSMSSFKIVDDNIDQSNMDHIINQQKIYFKIKIIMNIYTKMYALLRDSVKSNQLRYTNHHKQSTMISITKMMFIYIVLLYEMRPSLYPNIFYHDLMVGSETDIVISHKFIAFMNYLLSEPEVIYSDMLTRIDQYRDGISDSLLNVFQDNSSYIRKIVMMEGKLYEQFIINQSEPLSDDEWKEVYSIIMENPKLSIINIITKIKDEFQKNVPEETRKKIYSNMVNLITTIESPISLPNATVTDDIIRLMKDPNTTFKMNNEYLMIGLYPLLYYYSCIAHIIQNVDIYRHNLINFLDILMMDINKIKSFHSIIERQELSYNYIPEYSMFFYPERWNHGHEKFKQYMKRIGMDVEGYYLRASTIQWDTFSGWDNDEKLSFKDEVYAFQKASKMYPFDAYHLFKQIKDKRQQNWIASFYKENSRLFQLNVASIDIDLPYYIEIAFKNDYNPNEFTKVREFFGRYLEDFYRVKTPRINAQFTLSNLVNILFHIQNETFIKKTLGQSYTTLDLILPPKESRIMEDSFISKILDSPIKDLKRIEVAPRESQYIYIQDIPNMEQKIDRMDLFLDEEKEIESRMKYLLIHLKDKNSMFNNIKIGIIFSKVISFLNIKKFSLPDNSYSLDSISLYLLFANFKGQFRLSFNMDAMDISQINSVNIESFEPFIKPLNIENQCEFIHEIRKVVPLITQTTNITINTDETRTLSIPLNATWNIEKDNNFILIQSTINTSYGIHIEYVPDQSLEFNIINPRGIKNFFGF